MREHLSPAMKKLLKDPKKAEEIKKIVSDLTKWSDALKHTPPNK